MPSILLVSPTAMLGGAERIIHNIASYLLTEDWDVYVYVMSRGEQPGWEDLIDNPKFNIHFSAARSEKSSILYTLAWLLKLSRKVDLDYVFSSHTHVNAFLSFLRCCKVLKTNRLIGRESTFIFDRFFGIKRIFFVVLYRIFYGQHDLLICQTKGMKASLFSGLGYYPAKNTSVLPNPLNIKRIDSALEKSNKSWSQNNAENPFLIVACGRLEKVKGFDLLINAFSKLIISGVKAELIVIGSGPDREELESLSTARGVRSSITFTGRVENPCQVFYKSDLGVISSEKEGFPNVILEMMAARVKMIVSTPCTDGLSQLPNILVSESFDVDSLFHCMKSAADNRNDFSNDYREYVEKFRSTGFFWDNVQKHSNE